MRYTFILVGLLIAVAVSFTACGGTSVNPFGGLTNEKVRHYNLDGHDVPCIVLTSSQHSVAIWCHDWHNGQ